MDEDTRNPVEVLAEEFVDRVPGLPAKWYGHAAAESPLGYEHEAIAMAFDANRPG